MKFSRREFLLQSAVGLTAIRALAQGRGAATPPLPSGVPGTNAKKIIVLGAGLAGLCAAYELTQSGHDVIVLEARSHPGGRVRTLREPFDDGLYAEAGATRIPDNHRKTLHYIKHFDLPLIPFRSNGLSSIYYLRGRRIELKRGMKVQWPLNLTREEQELGIAGMRDKYINSFLENADEPFDRPGISPELRKWDEITWPAFLKQQGASDDAVLLLTYGHNAGVLNNVSALLWLRYTAFRRKRSQLYKIEGGNDLLPKAFAGRLGSRIRYESPVVDIAQTPEKVRVSVLAKGTHESLEADRLICTLPCSVLRNISCSPALSPKKRTAIEQLEYVSCARIYAQVSKRWWRDTDLDGFAITDLPVSEVWDISYGEPGDRGILLAYMTGAHAKTFSSMAEDKRVQSFADDLELMYPGSRHYVERGTSVCWDDDPWARGAWPLFAPGQLTSLFPELSAPEDRIHFAGDHTSAWPGWMQGALESGLRAAREAHEAP